MKKYSFLQNSIPKYEKYVIIVVLSIDNGLLAQLVEQLTLNQWV